MGLVGAHLAHLAGPLALRPALQHPDFQGAAGAAEGLARPVEAVLARLAAGDIAQGRGHAGPRLGQQGQGGRVVTAPGQGGALRDGVLPQARGDAVGRGFARQAVKLPTGELHAAAAEGIPGRGEALVTAPQEDGRVARPQAHRHGTASGDLDRLEGAQVVELAPRRGTERERALPRRGGIEVAHHDQVVLRAGEDAEVEHGLATRARLARHVRRGLLALPAHGRQERAEGHQRVGQSLHLGAHGGRGAVQVHQAIVAVAGEPSGRRRVVVRNEATGAPGEILEAHQTQLGTRGYAPVAQLAESLRDRPDAAAAATP